RDLKCMDGVSNPFNIAGHRFPVSVRKKGRHPAFVQQRDGLDMQSSLAFPIVPIVPGAQLEPPSVVPCPKDEDIPLTEPHSLGFLGSLELRPSNRLARPEPLDAAHPGNIQDHSPAHTSWRTSRT